MLMHLLRNYMISTALNQITIINVIIRLGSFLPPRGN
jgi:hypothetical protein